MTYASEVLADSPVAYWRLGEASGTSAADAAGSNTGTYHGSPTLGVTGGVVGDTAVTLDGTSQYITVPNAAELNFGDGPVSIEWWQYRTADSGRESKIFDKNANNAIQILENGAGTIELGKAGASIIVSTSVADTLNAWHHYVVTKNGSACKIWRNGTDVTGTVSNLTIGDATGQWVIGANRGASGDYFPGSLDEIAFYASVLSEARILAHYAARSAVAGSGRSAQLRHLLMGI